MRRGGRRDAGVACGRMAARECRIGVPRSHVCFHIPGDVKGNILLFWWYIDLLLERIFGGVFYGHQNAFEADLLRCRGISL